MTKLEPQVAAELLATLPHWTHDQHRGAITREFVFGNFVEAFSFMAQVALAAEE